MAKPDKVFKQAHDWFRGAVSQALSGVPPAQQAAVEKLVWQMLGLVQFNAPVPADPDLTDFKASGATADSLAVATQIAAESLTEEELHTLRRHYQRLAEMARSDGQVTVSHSIEEAEARHEFKRERRLKVRSG